MKKGWIKDYRQEEESLIWSMPPIYHRVWQHLKYNACFETMEIPMRDGSVITLLPGQYLTSYRTIASSIGWYERGLRKDPNPKTIEDILNWMESQNMITVSHGKFNRQYTLISIVNWDTYQNPADPMDKDISNTPDEPVKHTVDINNNYNNEKEEEEIKEKEEAHTYPQTASQKCEAKNTRDYTDEFELFWSNYPRKIEKKRAYKAFKTRIKSGIPAEDMISAALNYKKFCMDNGFEERYIKHPATFLGPDRPFEEYINCVPEIKRKLCQDNVSKALNLVNTAKSLEEDISLW